MNKEEILDKHTFTKMSMTKYQREDVLNVMQEFADQEKEKVAVAFVEWMATPGLHPEICSFMTPPQKYSYWIKNIYNK